MRGEMTAYERRNSILDFLWHNRVSTRTELSQKYHVSLVTIHRDLCFLTGIAPIMTKSGNGGGVFYIGERSKYINNYLTASELDCLTRLSKDATDRDRVTIENIIYRFSMPSENTEL